MSNLLLFASLLLPLAAAVHFLGSANRAPLAGRSLLYAWIYAAVAGATGVLALLSEGGIAVGGGLVALPALGFGLEPRLFLDGRNAAFLLLLAVCLPVVFTFLRDRRDQYGRGHYASAWMLTFGLAGVFLADSLLLFYFFWEAALVAVYFWIGLYGKRSHRGAEVYPSLLRFVLFTLAGSLPMLLSIAAVCVAGFRDPGLQGLPLAVEALSDEARGWVFLGFLAGFAVKLPLLGFHGWLRDTYGVAPAPCRALLSAAMSKMGAFGLLFVLVPAFPLEMQALAPWLLALAAAGALYGGLLMLAQDHLVDLLAYASLSHLSILALGVFAAAADGEVAVTGLSGAVLIVFNHAAIMALLFVLDARILEGGSSPDRGLVSGLRTRQRRLYAFLLLAVFASASLPGLSNFPGEVLIYFAAFKVSPWLTLVAGLGALIGAAALVRALHGIFLGKAATHRPDILPAADLGRGETALALALSALWLVLGLCPMLLLGPVQRAFSLIHSMGWMG